MQIFCQYDTFLQIIKVIWVFFNLHNQINLTFIYSQNDVLQIVPITTKAVDLNPAHGEVYSIQRYVIKFVSDLRKVSGFLHQ